VYSRKRFPPPRQRLLTPQRHQIAERAFDFRRDIGGKDDAPAGLRQIGDVVHRVDDTQPWSLQLQAGGDIFEVDVAKLLAEGYLGELFGFGGEQVATCRPIQAKER